MEQDDLARRLGTLLNAAQLTISTAESCTGGLIADMITNIPGSSQYFTGSVIVYSNEAKESVLGIPSSFLRSFGAVSAPVALAMARRGTWLFGTDICLSTTGIAGPTGGTAAKPVGLVYIAIVGPGYAACRHFLWPYDRINNKKQSALMALSLGCRMLETINSL